MERDIRAQVGPLMCFSSLLNAQKKNLIEVHGLMLQALTLIPFFEIVASDRAFHGKKTHF